jgi:hypothetical protein
LATFWTLASITFPYANHHHKNLIYVHVLHGKKNIIYMYSGKMIIVVESNEDALCAQIK